MPDTFPAREGQFPQNDASSSWPEGQPSQPNPNVRPVSLGSVSAPGYDEASALPEQDAEAVTAYRALEARRKRKRRNRVIAACIAAALALGAGGWFVSQNLRGGAPGESDLPAYELGNALVDTFEKSVSASGAIKPKSQVVVTPEVDGIISGVRVAEGDHVSKGDVLFTLRNDRLDKAVAEAEQALKTANNALASAQNGLASAQVSLQRAQDNYDKVFSTGYETQEEADAAGQQAFDTLSAAESGAEDAQLAVENAQSGVTNAQEALDQARANADKRIVTAPQDGAVVAMNAVEGASVGSSEGAASAGGSSSLVTIADLTSLRVSVQVNEVDINSVKEGQRAEVSFSALPDVVLTAVVERIASVSSSSSEGYSMGGGGIVTYDVDLLIDSPDPQVKPGMTARVKILAERIENAMTVPVAALTMTDDTHATVNVVVGYEGDAEPVFDQRIVTVVAQDAATAVVEGEIEDGDTLELSSSTAEDDSALTVSVG